MAEKYGWMGDSITAIIFSAMTNPFKILRHIFTLGNVQIILRLLLPVAFLNLGSIWGIVCLCYL
jgi:hypothetical protein